MSELDRPFFARLRSALLECPWCGELADLRTSIKGRDRVSGPRKIHAGSFDPLTARWKCRGCGLTGVLGVVLYLTDQKDQGEMPKDWKTTIAQAAKVRELGRGRISGQGWKGRRGKANQVRGGEDG